MILVYSDHQHIVKSSMLGIGELVEMVSANDLGKSRPPQGCHCQALLGTSVGHHVWTSPIWTEIDRSRFGRREAYLRSHCPSLMAWQSCVLFLKLC